MAREFLGVRTPKPPKQTPFHNRLMTASIQRHPGCPSKRYRIYAGALKRSNDCEKRSNDCEKRSNDCEKRSNDCEKRNSNSENKPNSHRSKQRNN
jgi:hypothetical protein